MKNLIRLRKELNKTQEEIADILDVSRTTYGKWEKGTHRPDTDMLVKLAEYFNVSADYLLGISDERNAPNAPTEEDEVWEMRREMSERTEMRTLFDLAKTAKKEDLDFANDLLKRLRGDEE